LGKPRDNPRSLISAYPVKISSWSAKQFSSYKDLNFLSFRLESPIYAPKISFLGGGFYPQNLGAHRSDPQKALPCAERRVLSLHWSRCDAQCDLWLWQRKQNKKEKKTVANWLFAQTIHVAVSKESLHAGWSPVCILAVCRSAYR